MSDVRDEEGPSPETYETEDRITAFLARCGVGDLPENPRPGDIERALRAAARSLNGSDRLKKATVRSAIIDKLKSIKVAAPARMVDAALDDRDDDSAHGDDDATGLQGQAFEFEDLEPWPQSVRGADLLDEIAATIQRFVVLPQDAADAVGLWAVFTYAIDRFQVSPRLNISSPTRECGKTLLQTILSALVKRPVMTSNITPAALFRVIEKFRPTLLVDEADTFVRLSDELRGILNSGHTRAAAFTVRCAGDDSEPRRFSTWAPISISGIGQLPDTLESRSICISLKRRRPDERVESFREDRIHGDLRDLRRRIARWVDDHGNALQAADPEVPEDLHDRVRDNWRPLLAIADLAGRRWPERSRQAATSLSGQREEDPSEAVQLLSDTREILSRRSGAFIRTADLLGELRSLPERPWSEFGRSGDSISARQIASLLKPFGVAPDQIKRGGTKVRGYRRTDFEDVFLRYLPAEPGTSGTALQDNNLRQFQSGTNPFEVPERTAPKSNFHNEVPPVPDRSGGTGARAPAKEPRTTSAPTPRRRTAKTVSTPDGASAESPSALSAVRGESTSASTRGTVDSDGADNADNADNADSKSRTTSTAGHPPESRAHATGGGRSAKRISPGERRPTAEELEKFVHRASPLWNAPAERQPGSDTSE